MKKTRFEQLYQQILENITTSSAGIGSTDNSHFSNDTYAPGDARIPKVIGIGSRKKKRKIPIITRPFTRTL